MYIFCVWPDLSFTAGFSQTVAIVIFLVLKLAVCCWWLHHCESKESWRKKELRTLLFAVWTHKKKGLSVQIPIQKSKQRPSKWPTSIGGFFLYDFSLLFLFLLTVCLCEAQQSEETYRRQGPQPQTVRAQAVGIISFESSSRSEKWGNVETMTVRPKPPSSSTHPLCPFAPSIFLSSGGGDVFGPVWRRSAA